MQTTERPAMTADEQFQCLNILDYLIELFSVTPRKSFTQEQILSVLNQIKHDPEVFDLRVVAAQEETTTSLEVIN